MDPFELAARRTQRAVRPPDGRQEGLATMMTSQYVPHVLGGLASLPERTFQAAGSLQYGGDYDPRPALETAGLMATGPIPRGGFGAISLTRLPRSRYQRPGSDYLVAKSDKPGMPAFDVTTIYHPDKRKVEVEWMGLGTLSPGDVGPNMFGPTEIRSFLRAIKQEYPEAETIGGLRVSGARTGRAADVEAKLPKGGSDAP